MKLKTGLETYLTKKFWEFETFVFHILQRIYLFSENYSRVKFKNKTTELQKKLMELIISTLVRVYNQKMFVVP